MKGYHHTYIYLFFFRILCYNNNDVDFFRKMFVDGNIGNPAWNGSHIVGPASRVTKTFREHSSRLLTLPAGLSF